MRDEEIDVTVTYAAPPYAGRHRAFDDADPVDPWASANETDDLTPIHAFPPVTPSLRPRIAVIEYVGDRVSTVYASRYAAATREKVAK